MFLTFAAAVAYRRGLKHIVGGMCETDFSGYPDCRDETIRAMQMALNLGMASDFVMETPLMWLTKAETWGLAERLGGATLVDVIRDQTVTCYMGDTTTRQEWGTGCGKCPACDLRGRAIPSIGAPPDSGKAQASDQYRHIPPYRRLHLPDPVRALHSGGELADRQCRHILRAEWPVPDPGRTRH